MSGLGKYFLYDAQDYGRVLIYTPETGYWRWRHSVKRDLEYILRKICRPIVKLERLLRRLRKNNRQGAL